MILNQNHLNDADLNQNHLNEGDLNQNHLNEGDLNQNHLNEGDLNQNHALLWLQILSTSNSHPSGPISFHIRAPLS